MESIGYEKQNCHLLSSASELCPVVELKLEISSKDRLEHQVQRIRVLSQRAEIKD
jgi:hypothetical protein